MLSGLRTSGVTRAEKTGTLGGRVKEQGLLFYMGDQRGGLR
jgi:hypothetical protein